jgi:hypothetical protein
MTIRTRYKFNINDKLMVKLTTSGKLQYAKYYRYIETPMPPIKYEDGYACFTVWEAMHIFGPQLSAGGNLLFETEVLVEVRS